MDLVTLSFWQPPASYISWTGFTWTKTGSLHNLIDKQLISSVVNDTFSAAEISSVKCDDHKSQVSKTFLETGMSYLKAHTRRNTRNLLW
jgi:hypothetical protein